MSSQPVVPEQDVHPMSESSSDVLVIFQCLTVTDHAWLNTLRLRVSQGFKLGRMEAIAQITRAWKSESFKLVRQ